MIRKVFLLLLLSLAIAPALVVAVCPVCTVAVGAGVGVLRAWGIDDVISGLWYGGLVVSSLAWTLSALHKRGKLKPWHTPVWAVSFLLIFIAPLPWMGVTGIPGNALLGMDKFLLGTGAGMLVFIIAIRADKGLRRLNDGKHLFAYQKVVIPVVFLSLLSAVAFLLLKIIGAYP